MERRKTLSEIRYEEAQKRGRAAKELGDKALRDIDHALAEEAELLQSLNVAVEYGNLTPEEADVAIIAYRQTRYGNVVE